ncbi:MAG TPA: response regulator [Candidatus Binatia bacterium]|jgi:pilus assembly protein CpaE|nr:response regulator [Candidatus Binatia bacterium]
MTSGKKARILVIDDDANLLRVMGVLLERAGYLYSAASNGVEGLSAAASEKPDLVVLDVAMPFMKGTEVCRRLREQGATSRIPVIMMSNLERIEDKLAGFQAGADDYVTKPVNPKELLARINALLVRSHFSVPQSAKIIALVGAKGGVGVSSLAVNMAATLGQLDYSVTLAELRPGRGELWLHLGLPAEPNLEKLLALDATSTGRSDVERFVQQHESGLRVLFSPEHVAEHPLTPEHVAAIVEALSLGTDFLILDLPPLLDQTVRKAAEAADLILLVSEPEALSATCARMQLRTLKQWKVDGRVSVVAVARVPSGTTMTRLELENELSMGRLERMRGSEESQIISVAVISVIPPEPEAFQESVVQGVPLVKLEPSARSSRAIAELAEKLANSLLLAEAR